MSSPTFDAETTTEPTPSQDAILLDAQGERRRDFRCADLPNPRPPTREGVGDPSQKRELTLSGVRTLRQVSETELAEILRLHALFLDDQPNGELADLSGADLTHADLRSARLAGANLSGANLFGAYLHNARAYGVNLRGAYLRYADLRDASLCHADLRGASLYNADLHGANLVGADLRGANLIGADLCHADLTGADLRDVHLWHNLETNQNLRAATFQVFSGLYQYPTMAIVAVDDTPWVRMGCHWKPVKEWDRIGIRRSNPDGFPDNGSFWSEQRVRAFEFTRGTAMQLVEDWRKKSTSLDSVMETRDE